MSSESDPSAPEDPGASIGDSLRKKYGREVDPEVSLDGEPEKADLTSELVGRLVSKSARYKLKSEVARGGMGVILKVWDENLRRHLAMKVVLGPGQGSQPASVNEVDPKMLGRFLEEAQVTGQLDHPGVVPVHELGLDDDGGVFFTMRLVRGRDLKHIFHLVHHEKEGWNPTRALGVMLKVCEAMAYAHSKGVIHRDLKPANIMVGRFGEVYVMDWGLARVLGMEDLHDLRIDEKKKVTSESALHIDSAAFSDPDLRTMDGDVIGTPAYMSPEQAQGKLEELGPRADVFSVGSMLYHLLTGLMPYANPGEKVGPIKLLMRSRKGPPTPLAELAPDVAPELEAICEKAMQREAKDRYADMQELAEDLRAYLEHRVVKAYETGAVAEIKKWIARNKGFAAVSAAALASLVVGLATSWVLYLRAEHNAELAEDRRVEAEANEQTAKREKVRADENASEARRSEELATKRKEEAEAERIKVLRLSDMKRLESLEAEAADLWPADPSRIDEYKDWVARARLLVDRLPDHRDALAELRAESLQLTPAQQASDRAIHPEFAELEALEEHWARHQPGHPDSEAVNAEYAPGDLERHLQADQGALSELRSAVEDLRMRVFASAEKQWQHDLLLELVGKLGAFADPAFGRVRDVQSRLEFARTVESRTRSSPEARRLWAQAIASIADPQECPQYEGLQIEPQLGLLPLGRDATSGLWEFAHAQSGEITVRGEDGKLILAEETGLVLVLIPAGTFLMGGQDYDPDLPNYDPALDAKERAVREIALDAFFMSKYEMTQGQWERFTAENPSAYKPGKGFFGVLRDYSHPVEQVSWAECDRVLRNMVLTLPTEAQWEYAARGGTDTVWWTGSDRDSLIGFVNFADRTAARAGANWAPINEWPELEDGHVVHAKIGTYGANLFGLHEIHGNVHEWCLDWYTDYDRPVDPGTGMRQSEQVRHRIYRGGGFLHSASKARCAARDGNTPGYSGSSLGVRPAKLIER